LTRERFAGPEWIFERKLDGIRLLAFKRGQEVQLLSRNQLPQNVHYPELVSALGALPVGDAIFDGEGLGVWGRQHEPGYHLFDVLWIGGNDVTGLPLAQRRQLLERLPLEPPLHLVDRRLGSGAM
jgi:bifunctional non-homologous end joining protein LigD